MENSQMEPEPEVVLLETCTTYEDSHNSCDEICSWAGLACEGAHVYPSSGPDKTCPDPYIGGYHRTDESSCTEEWPFVVNIDEATGDVTVTNIPAEAWRCYCYVE